MTCHCHDPYVFGHTTCGRETQPWTQPPIGVYHAGETFTINTTAFRTLTEAAQHNALNLRELAQTLTEAQQATITAWNWLQAAETTRNQAQPPITGEPCP